MEFYDVFYKDENQEEKSRAYYVQDEEQAEKMFRAFGHEEEIIKIEVHKRKEQQ